MKRDDTLWKAILEDIFEDFLRFFYKEADKIFDIERGFEFLDKELEDLFPEIEHENIRYVDKLVKIWLKDGTEEWILVHIEVQGKAQKIFEERMFTYFYRIRDKYQRKITAWAILTDKNKRFLPKEYVEAYLGTKLSYQFNTYKVVNQDEMVLRNMGNPFSIVILTVLLALKKHKTSELELIDLKMDLIKQLLNFQIPKEKIRALMNFLKHYVRFSKENTIIFEEKLEQFTGKTYPMGIEQFLLQRAENQGILKGEKRGKLEVIRNARINGASIDFIAKIVNLPIEKIHKILEEMGIE